MSELENNINETPAVVEEKTEETALEPEITSKKLTQVEYDVKNEEEGQAFYLFQKKYVYKRNWIITILFAIVAILFFISIGRNPDQPLNYILATICIAIIFITWFNTKKIRTSLLEALRLIEDDRYIFTLYEDCFKIETILADDVDENGEKIPPVQPRVVFFDSTAIDAFEKDNMFILIVNKKETIFVLPKRCMQGDSESVIRETLKAKLGENYQTIS